MPSTAHPICLSRLRKNVESVIASLPSQSGGDPLTTRGAARPARRKPALAMTYIESFIILLGGEIMIAAERLRFPSIGNLLRRPEWSVFILLGLAIILIPLPFRTDPPADRTFRIEARRFEYLPSEIRVNPGDRVTIELAAMDVSHGLSIDGYGLSVTAEPGQSASLTFVANRSGTFRFRCTVICGALHPFMIGKLNVGVNTTGWKVTALSVLVAAFGIGIKRA
jgi:plastocyanin